MTRGQLEATVAEGGRAQALAPPDVSGQLRLTAQAEADAWQQSADAEVRHDQAEAVSAKALAGQLGAEKARLEAIHADYESWSGKTRQAREVAGKAEAELQRRGMQPPEPEQSLIEWDRAARLDELQARADEAAQRIAADEAEQQASVDYVARIERQAQAEPQPDWSAERDDAEMEL